ncbi:hypothetical protein O6H91_Y081700 [Diphasiastrum complanatum]|nr:hypothetical protein O6H91_Y081700 [Diphasiastrum complanatum]
MKLLITPKGDGEQTIAPLLALLLFFLVFVWAFVFCTGSALTAGDDEACIAGLKLGLYDPQATLSSWNGDALASPCFNQSLTLLSGITCNANRVVSIQLSSKGLAGSVSSSISNCTFLNLVDFSNNDLTGEMQPELGDLLLLTSLNLSLNRFLGVIPDALTNCSYLSSLDLHKNSLSGTIPLDLGYLVRLKIFDVSDNDLSGSIPYSLGYNFTGGPRFNVSSFRGNKGLYGYPLPYPKVRTFSVVAIVGIGLASGLLSLVISFVAVCVWLKVSEHRLAAEEGKISQLMAE